MNRLPILLAIFILSIGCKKVTPEAKPSEDADILSVPNPQLCLPGNCNVTADAGFNMHFTFPGSAAPSILLTTLAPVYGNPSPSNFIYNSDGNPASCTGLGVSGCYNMHYNNSFTYQNGKILRIQSHRSFDASCPNNQELNNQHYAVRVEFTHSNKLIMIGNYPALIPVITAVFKVADTINIAQPITSFVETGQQLYMEFSFAGKLTLKRYTPPSGSGQPIKEFRYSYTDGNLNTIKIFEGLNERARYTFSEHDSRKHFASGSAVMRLLTSNYSDNNPKVWSYANYANETTTGFNCSYGYNSRCFPTTANLFINGLNAGNPLTCSYTCN